jgi:hypothetical protein
MPAATLTRQVATTNRVFGQAVRSDLHWFQDLYVATLGYNWRE